MKVVQAGPRLGGRGNVVKKGYLAWGLNVLCMPGNDLLSRLGSTIGAGAFHGRVRDGIGWGRSARITRQTKDIHDLIWVFVPLGLASGH